MLSSQTLAVLLVAMIGASCAEPRTYAAQRADSRSPAYDSQNTPSSAVPINYHGSVTIQKDNTYLTQPGTTNLYGSITRQSNQVYESDNVQDPGREEYISMQSGGSDPRRFQTSNGENVVVHGAITSQSHTTYVPRPNYPSQQSSILPEAYSSQTSSRPQQAPLQDGGIPRPTSSPARESTGELRSYLQTLTAELHREIHNLGAEIRDIRNSVTRLVSNQEVMNSKINRLLYNQQTQNQARYRA